MWGAQAGVHMIICACGRRQATPTCSLSSLTIVSTYFSTGTVSGVAELRVAPGLPNGALRDTHTWHVRCVSVDSSRQEQVVLIRAMEVQR